MFALSCAGSSMWTLQKAYDVEYVCLLMCRIQFVDFTKAYDVEYVCFMMAKPALQLKEKEIIHF
jgi:hypothetical protein